MKREGASTLLIHGFPWALSYLLRSLALLLKLFEWCFVFGVILKVFWKETIILAIFVMILVRQNVYKDVCLLKNVSMFWKMFGKCFEMCVCLFLKIVRIVWKRASNLELSTLLKCLSYAFLFLWHCWFTIDLVNNPIFGC